MFAELRQQVSQLTADRNFPVPRQISRVFFVVVSSSLFPLKPWFQQWFPIRDDEIAQFYPWLLVPEQEDVFRKEAEAAVGRAFSADRANTITLRGISILDSINQVLVVADLCDRDISHKMARTCKIIDNVLQRFIDPRSPVYWTGIFLLRRPPSQVAGNEKKTEDAGEKISGLPSSGKEIIDQILQEAPWSLFHRVFFLDISNPQGTFLSEEKDQRCLAGHLLYFLITYPMSAELPHQFAEWLLRNNADEGFVSGFSAFSLVVPIDQILETIAIFKGTEVMKESLLTERSPDRHLLYLSDFLQKNSMLQLEEVKKAVSEDSSFPLRDPTDSLPDFSTMRSEDYLETVNAIDGSLPGTAKDHAEAMEKIGERLLINWKESLEDHLETMATHELGGLLMAKKFLQSLQTHIEKILPPKVEPPQYSDPGGCILTLWRLLDRGPRKEAIYGRALTLALVSEVAVASFPLSLLTKVLLLVGLPALSLALAFFVSYSARQEIQNQILTLVRLLREKWKALIEAERLKVAERCLKDLLERVKKLQKEVESALKRVEELVDYFQNRYLPPFPEEFAFWKYVVKEREELLQFQDLCRADISTVAGDYLEKDRPLLLWHRLSPPTTSEPNPLEQSLVEKAAIRVLPDCADILNLHILSFLQTGNRQIDGYKMAMIRGAQPFLNLHPGSRSPELNAALEVESGDDRPFIEQLMRALSAHFHTIQQVSARSPYRLSFFGFLEGAKTDDVLLR